MARIISFQESRGRRTSINLETVRGMSSSFWYEQKRVEVKLSFWDKLRGKPDFDFVDDTSRPVYRLILQYKNHRQEDDTFYFDKEEFERVRAELARYGWII